MSKVETLEREVEALSQEELVKFREWFAGFDADAWDREIEKDANAGRLDAVADAAISSFRAGRCSEL
ncbi:MAG: hypothetical protein HYX75_17910 [Acidobacteria bacterium]|nr:hypothetical protein [Acidobacteriota bacterium]